MSKEIPKMDLNTTIDVFFLEEAGLISDHMTITRTFSTSKLKRDDAYSLINQAKDDAARTLLESNLKYQSIVDEYSKNHSNKKESTDKIIHLASLFYKNKTYIYEFSLANFISAIILKLQAFEKVHLQDAIKPLMAKGIDGSEALVTTLTELKSLHEESKLLEQDIEAKVNIYRLELEKSMKLPDLKFKIEEKIAAQGNLLETVSTNIKAEYSLNKKWKLNFPFEQLVGLFLNKLYQRVYSK